MRYWEFTKEDPRVRVTPNMSPKVARAVKAMKAFKFETDANQRKALLSKGFNSVKVSNLRVSLSTSIVQTIYCNFGFLVLITNAEE